MQYELGFAEAQDDEEESEAFGETTWTTTVDAAELSLAVAGWVAPSIRCFSMC